MESTAKILQKFSYIECTFSRKYMHSSKYMRKNSMEKKWNGVNVLFKNVLLKMSIIGDKIIDIGVFKDASIYFLQQEIKNSTTMNSLN